MQNVRKLKATKENGKEKAEQDEILYKGLLKIGSPLFKSKTLFPPIKVKEENADN